MKTNQFKVVNRTTQEEQIFNSDELKRFFHCEYDLQTSKIRYNNDMRDYAISTQKDEMWKFIDNIVIAVVSVSLIVCITKLILLWN